MNKNIVFILLIIVFFACGIGFGFLIFNRDCPALHENNTYEAGWQAAKYRLEKLGVIQPLKEGTEIKRLNGTIVKIEDKKITMEITPIEPLADPSLDNRFVVLGTDTKIFQIKPKDQEKYEAELSQYKAEHPNYKDLVNTDDFPMPPERIVKEPVLADKLLTGMKIIADADENIVTAKEFTAREITIQP